MKLISANKDSPLWRRNKLYWESGSQRSVTSFMSLYVINLDSDINPNDFDNQSTQLMLLNKAYYVPLYHFQRDLDNLNEFNWYVNISIEGLSLVSSISYIAIAISSPTKVSRPRIIGIIETRDVIFRNTGYTSLYLNFGEIHTDLDIVPAESYLSTYKEMMIDGITLVKNPGILSKGQYFGNHKHTLETKFTDLSNINGISMSLDIIRENYKEVVNTQIPIFNDIAKSGSLEGFLTQSKTNLLSDIQNGKLLNFSNGLLLFITMNNIVDSSPDDISLLINDTGVDSSLESITPLQLNGIYNLPGLYGTLNVSNGKFYNLYLDVSDTKDIEGMYVNSINSWLSFESINQCTKSEVFEIRVRSNGQLSLHRTVTGGITIA